MIGKEHQGVEQVQNVMMVGVTLNNLKIVSLWRQRMIIKQAKIERDFKFIRYGEKCKRSGLPCYAGATNRCEKCQHYGGLITPWEMIEFTCRNLGDDSYVVCKHPDAQDSKDSEHFISIWYEHFRNEAISHYYD